MLVPLTNLSCKQQQKQQREKEKEEDAIGLISELAQFVAALLALVVSWQTTTKTTRETRLTNARKPQLESCKVNVARDKDDNIMAPGVRHLEAARSKHNSDARRSGLRTQSTS